MPTILDVAKLAGVSRSTVSRVLNESPRVDDTTRQKVFSAIEQLQYEPSHFARHLRKQETKLIAVLVPDISNPFFSRLLEGMEEIALEYGYKIVLCITGDRLDREIQYIRMLESKQADGIILTALRNPLDRVKPYLQYGPIVFANEYTDGDFLPSVAIDNIASSRMIVRHLLSLGHSRVAFINGPEHIIICRDRKIGYCSTLEESGIPVDPDLLKESDYTQDGGFRSAMELLDLPSPPTAIFAANDTMGVGVIQALKHRSVRVPEQVMVAGFDNNPFSTVIEPNLTTVDQPIQLMGAEAVKLLFRCLEQGISKVEPRRMLMETVFIARQSTGR